MIALAQGGVTGSGVGRGGNKLADYLPLAQSDFIFAVIAEELGLAGVVLVIVLFALVVQRAFAIGRQAIVLERVFGGLAAQGIGIWFGAQSFINMGVNLGVLPTKGLTLPLLSYGGSGVLLNLVSVCNSEDPKVLWGFISRYVPNATPATEPFLDRLVGRCLRRLLVSRSGVGAELIAHVRQTFRWAFALIGLAGRRTVARHVHCQQSVVILGDRDRLHAIGLPT